ncbi:toxin-antitoxin system YwqK family antitoxin [Stigmatella erecta]|uniref:MORN repeat variant n=1 Tax=Stigmatella erecta TaxID=83460 RepID=A0A1I0JAJ7_9BACT|nr:hypothetical protein [Stigmatella erecta]SEU06929.1 MORN repeat variant [Stigmatella erecta]
MFFSKPSRSLVMVLAVAAAPAAFAGDTVRLNCPAGTVRKEHKKEAVYCVKAQAEAGEPKNHGPYVDLHPNGKKMAEGQYQDGFRSGLWTFWDANGAKAGETNFSGGSYHGTRIEYHANGQKKTEQQWNQGKREGLSVAYSEDGQKVAETQFQSDRVVKEQRFENGKPVASK